MGQPVVYDRKIRFSDTDAQGIVYNVAYLVYWDDAFNDYIEAIGCSWDLMLSHGDDVVLARTEINYRTSAVLGNTVRTSMRAVRIGNTSFTMECVSTNLATGETLADGTQIQVMVDSKTFRPKPVPDYMRQLIETWEGNLSHPPEV